MIMTLLHYLDPNPSGSPAVLLLHGLGANSYSWTLQFDPLISAGFRPIAPDTPGFGESPYDGRGWSVARSASAMADLLQELEAIPAHMVGISMGGTIAQQIALDFPQLVRKLVLVSTFAILRPTRLSGWFYFLQRFILVHTLGLPTQARLVAGRIFPGEDQQIMRDQLIKQISQADPRAYRVAMRSLGVFNSKRRLGEIKKPTLIVTGDRDSTVPLPSQRILVERIPGARQVIIPGAGHAVTIDQPELFNRELLGFLRE
jgi:3-oxoadipate enol-lactonase